MYEFAHSAPVTVALRAHTGDVNVIAEPRDTIEVEITPYDDKGGEGRRASTRVFPNGILYTIESDYVLIVAVAHRSRAPGYWQHRLQ